MTREFNKQQRFDPRPSFRRTPPNSHGEERSSRPLRPRLNREIVDRAWENGAAHRHPDYQRRPQNHQGQAPRNAWQKNHYGAPSSPHGPAGNRPYGNRQDTQYQNRQQQYQKHGQPPFNGDRGSRRQSFDRQPDYYSNDATTERRSNTPWHARNGRATPGDQQRFRHQGQPQRHGPGSGFRQHQEPSHYNRGRNEGQHFYGGQGRPDFEKGRGNYTQPGPRQGNYRQNNYQPHGPNTTRPSPYMEQFKGDYERFDYEHDGRPGWNRGPVAPGNRDSQAPEQHVTRLPDGRVLKGPRPVQRKSAQFWNGVTEETSSLLNQVHAPPPQEEPAAPARDTVEPPIQAHPGQSAGRTKPVAGKRPARRIASAARRKKAATPRAYPPGPRPSQRGFKWPSPE